jgi:phosphoglycerate dehydrogenase-like enzyme
MRDAMLRVHLGNEPEPGQRQMLAELLDPSVRLSAGEDGTPPGTEILVQGFPTPEALAANPSLRALIVPWAGPPLETLDLLKRFPGIALHNLPYNAGPTAEMAVALLLAAAKLIVPYDRNFRLGRWGPPQPELRSGVLLGGKSAVVLGHGRVGQRVAEALRGLGMAVRAVRRQRGPDDPEAVHGVDALPDLLPRAAALVVCLPLTHATRGLIGERELALLPGDAVLVNVARGSIVEEAALYRALAERRIFAAGIDVWYRYPGRSERKPEGEAAPSNFPFHDLDNVVMSPHRAGWSAETEEARLVALAGLLNRAARGEPMPNRVDPGRGY